MLGNIITENITNENVIVWFFSHLYTLHKSSPQSFDISWDSKTSSHT